MTRIDEGPVCKLPQYDAKDVVDEVIEQSVEITSNQNDHEDAG